MAKMLMLCKQGVCVMNDLYTFMFVCCKDGVGPLRSQLCDGISLDDLPGAVRFFLSSTYRFSFDLSVQVYKYEFDKFVYHDIFKF